MRLSLLTLAGLFLAPQPLIAQQNGKVKFTQLEIAAAKRNPLAFTIDPTTIEIVNLGPVVDLKQNIQLPIVTPKLPGPPKAPSGKDPLVVIDKIINTMKKIWEIIEKNKPVVDIKTSFANAIPEGITHWGQLGGWHPPEGTLYGFTAKNGYGSQVINVRYQVLRTYGGTYKGKGKYLTSVTVIPLRTDVSWGYTFSMAAEAPSVANMGTVEDPIASMILNLKWKIATVIKDSRGTSVYFLQGDGKFKELGGPFKKSAQQQVSKKLEGLRKTF